MSTTLDRLMSEGEVATSDLADRLKVSRQAVSAWRTGKDRLPLARASELAKMFDVKVSDFSDQVSLQAGAKMEPLNVFAWTLHDNGPLGHIGSDWSERLEIVSETIECEVEEIIEAALHRKKLSEQTALAFMRTYLPGINPVALDGCVVGQPSEPEWAAVVRLGVEFDTYTPCFAEARKMLDAAEKAYWEEAHPDLDDGRKVPEQWWRIIESYSKTPWPVP